MVAGRQTSALIARSLASAARSVGSKHRLGVGSTFLDRCSVAWPRCLFSTLPDHTVVGMPALSPTMTHGNLGAWSKQVGDEIAAGDVVCEVETDKATVDFDAQDDSIMAKHLVGAGAQDIAVGTPIFVTVDDADSIEAFKDFQPESAEEAPASAAGEENAMEKPPEDAPKAPETPPPAASKKGEKKVAPAAAPSPAPTPEKPAKQEHKPDEAPAAVLSPEAPRTSSDTSSDKHMFKREWGSGVKGSPLAHRMSAEQKKYVARFGSTLQEPLEP